MIFESVMDHVSRELSIAPGVLRERHLYQKDDVTHFVSFSEMFVLACSTKKHGDVVTLLYNYTSFHGTIFGKDVIDFLQFCSGLDYTPDRALLLHYSICFRKSVQ